MELNRSLPSENSYPEPTAGIHNPYPAIQGSATASSPEITSADGSSHSVFPQPSFPNRGFGGSSASGSVNQYDFLTRQFGLGSNERNIETSPSSSSFGGPTTFRNGQEGRPMASDYLNLQPSQSLSMQAQDATDDEQNASEYDNEPTSTVTGASPSNQRGKGGRGGRARGRKGWKWALKGTAHDPALDREPRERPRGRPRGSQSGRGRRGRLDPGREFKEKQSRATQAFVEERFDEALEYAREAVQANPEIFLAHSLLSDILRAKGQEQDSLAALLSGANTARDPATWVLVAERTLEFAGEDRSSESLEQAVFCYTQAIDLEKNGDRNFEARYAKMLLWMELGEATKARRDCKLLVAMRPNDIELVRQLAELCAMTGDQSEFLVARKAYELALDETYKPGLAVPEDQMAQAWSHLNIYIEIVDRTSSADEAVMILKRLARRFLGRSDETFWDSWTNDDREFDTGPPRRYQVGEFQQGHASRELSQYGEGLPLELRVKLGLSRLKMGGVHLPEAMEHFEHLMQFADDLDNLYDVFYLVGTKLRASGELQAALQFLEPVKEIQDVLTDEFWMHLGHCYKGTDQYEAACDCFTRAIEYNAANIDAKVDLAHLYQDNLSQPEKAWKLVDEIIAMNRRDVLKRENIHMRPRPAKKSRRLSKPSNQRSHVSDEERDVTGSRPSKQFVIAGSEVDGATDAATDEQQDEMPLRGQKALNSSSFVPAGTGSFGGFSLAEPNEELNWEELQRQEEAAWQDEDQSQRKLEQLQRSKDKAEQRKAKRNAQRTKAPKKTNDRQRLLLENQAEEVHALYAIIEELWPSLESGDEDPVNEWIETASELYEIFRGIKQFYPTRDKQKHFRGFFRLEAGERKFMDEMEEWRKQLRAGDTAPDDEQRDGEAGAKDNTDQHQAPRAPDESVPRDFHGISFIDWHHIFVDLALLFAKRSQRAACFEVIDNGMYGANVFYHDPYILNTTQATSFCCGFIFNDSERLCSAARWFINKSEFRSGSAYQLLAGVNRVSYGGNMWFSAGPTQKHMLRAVKALDYHVFDPDVRARFDWSLQAPALHKRVERFGEGAGELDTGALLLYGHMVGMANHSQSALPYFFRAFALQPENVTVNLSIATMYIANAMKRQTDNRQFGIAQGLSFLARYYEFRCAGGGALEKQEAEYNVGRAWHMIGLGHSAIKWYESALALSPDVQREKYESAMRGESVGEEDFAQEAAFALVNLFAITGNDEAARQLTEKWLVL